MVEICAESYTTCQEVKFSFPREPRTEEEKNKEDEGQVQNGLGNRNLEIENERSAGEREEENGELFCVCPKQSGDEGGWEEYKECKKRKCVLEKSVQIYLCRLVENVRKGCKERPVCAEVRQLGLGKIGAILGEPVVGIEIGQGIVRERDNEQDHGIEQERETGRSGQVVFEKTSVERLFKGHGIDPDGQEKNNECIDNRKGRKEDMKLAVFEREEKGYNNECADGRNIEFFEPVK